MNSKAELPRCSFEIFTITDEDIFFVRCFFALLWNFFAHSTYRRTTSEQIKSHLTPFLSALSHSGSEKKLSVILLLLLIFSFYSAKLKVRHKLFIMYSSEGTLLVKVYLLFNYTLMEYVMFVSQQMRCIFRCVSFEAHFFILSRIAQKQKEENK